MTAVIDEGEAGPRWAAVFAIAFSIAGLITAELLPVSILTPMARDLGISEGLAGQSLTATALAAIVSSLLAGTLTRLLDRRTVVLAFTLAIIASDLLVSIAPSFGILLAGRLLLGAVLGGFWAMAAALTMRLVPAQDVPKALSIVFGGVSVALVIAAPLGSLLGNAVGWRGVFVVAAIFSAACLLWQMAVLPALSAAEPGDGRGIVAIARRPGIGVAMVAIFCVFAGQFAFFSYMRPFYEGVTGLGIGALSAILLVFGIANFAGTSLSAPLLRRRLKAALVGAPAILALCAGALGSAGAHAAAAFAVTAAWGFVFGFVPVGWSTWITRAVPDEAESAGGLQVATIQLANTIGAALGGLVLEGHGPSAPVWAAAVLLLLTVPAALRVRVAAA